MRLNPEARIKIMWRDHPLARANGQVSVPRALLYQKIGPGEHPCRTCGKLVSWHDKGDKRLIVEQGDGDNLWPSCFFCNFGHLQKGQTHCKQGHEFTEASTYIQTDGARLCRICRTDRVRRRQP